MNRKCKICNSPDVYDINNLMLKNKSLAYISSKFGFSATSLRIHKKKHLSEDFMKEIESCAVARVDVSTLASKDEVTDNIANTLEGINNKMEYIAGRQVLDGDFRGAVLTLTQLRNTLETKYRLLDIYGKSKENKDWKNAVNKILDALEAFPEAKIKAAEALLESE